MKKLISVPLIILTTMLMISSTTAYDSLDEELQAIQKEIDNQGYYWIPAVNPIVTDYTPEERRALSGLKLPDNWEEIWKAHLSDDF